MESVETKIIDLGEATALLTLGFKLIRLENPSVKARAEHKIFVFENVHGIYILSHILESYNRRTLSLDAYTFYRAGKDLKNRIHEHKMIHS